MISRSRECRRLRTAAPNCVFFFFSCGTGAITFRERLVRDVMTPADRVFALKSSDRLDYALLTQIYRTGFSRVSVEAARRCVCDRLACCNRAVSRVKMCCLVLHHPNLCHDRKRADPCVGRRSNTNHWRAVRQGPYAAESRGQNTGRYRRPLLQPASSQRVRR